MDRESLVRAFRFQSDASARIGSGIYEFLLARCADDIEAGGPALSLVEAWEGDPILDNLPLRLMGAIHREVLSGRAPTLAAYYPSEGGRFETEPAWDALRAIVGERAERLRPELDTQLQTNEVNRACALVAGAHAFSRATGERPLRLLEIGASAGLNLVLERHRYRFGAAPAFGPVDAPLTLEAEWRGAPFEPAKLAIHSRAGCDPAPIDLRDETARIRLQSFVWPDQVERMQRLRAAIEVARPDPPTLVQARAKDWLPEVLRERPEGVPTLLQQSVMWWYVPEDEQREVIALMDAVGASASYDTPLGWLRMEGKDASCAELRLTRWPGGEETLLGRAHYHGAWVEWLGGER